MVIAVVAAPVLVAAALGTVKTSPQPATAATPPTPSALDAIVLLCPSPLGSDPTLSVARAEESVLEGADEQPEGEIRVGLGDAGEPLKVPVGGVAVAPPSNKAEVVSGTGSMAPGLVGSLVEAKPLAASDCGSAAAEQWFTGLGAGPTHASQLELVNPDDANAVADVTVYSDEGIVDVSELRGIAVPAGSSVPLNLAELLPQRGQLGLKVSVSRGRLGVFVVDQDDELGAGDSSQEWVPAQPEPAVTSVLLGVPTSSDGEQKLVVTNPGPNEAVVSLKVLTATSAFVPSGLPELQIPPESVGVFTLSDALAVAPTAPPKDKKDKKDKKKADKADEQAVAQEAPLGLLLESSEPVASSLRSVVGGDLSFTGADAPVDQGRIVVPAVDPTDGVSLVLSNGPVATAAKVRFLDAKGDVVAKQDVTGVEFAAVEVKVPAGTASISVDSVPGVSAALLVTGAKGNVVLTLRPLLTTLLVPAVQPTIR